MKISFISDVHIEHRQKQITVDSGDILFVAGDLAHSITVIENFLNYYSKKFGKVVYIPGNHEFYCRTIKSFYNELNAGSFGNNVIFPNSNEGIVFDYNGKTIAATTLWADLKYNEYACYYGCSDFRKIIGADGDDYITISEYKLLHEEAKLFLQNSSADIICTHFLPLYELVPPEYKGSNLNSVFVGDCTSVLYSTNVKEWVYGHTHTPNNIMIADVNFICNPIGY